jgi:hypothetical protein
MKMKIISNINKSDGINEMASIMASKWRISNEMKAKENMAAIMAWRNGGHHGINGAESYNSGVAKWQYQWQ